MELSWSTVSSSSCMCLPQVSLVMMLSLSVLSPFTGVRAALCAVVLGTTPVLGGNWASWLRAIYPRFSSSTSEQTSVKLLFHLAQDLWKLFYKAHPKAKQGTEEAEDLERLVLRSLPVRIGADCGIEI